MLCNHLADEASIARPSRTKLQLPLFLTARLVCIVLYSSRRLIFDDSAEDQVIRTSAWTACVFAHLIWLRHSHHGQGSKIRVKLSGTTKMAVEPTWIACVFAFLLRLPHSYLGQRLEDTSHNEQDDADDSGDDSLALSTNEEFQERAVKHRGGTTTLGRYMQRQYTLD